MMPPPRRFQLLATFRPGEPLDHEVVTEAVVEADAPDTALLQGMQLFPDAKVIECFPQPVARN